jgi:hypothetical protein
MLFSGNPRGDISNANTQLSMEGSKRTMTRKTAVLSTGRKFGGLTQNLSILKILRPDKSAAEFEQFS